MALLLRARRAGARSPSVGAQSVDCEGPAGDPQPGTPEWEQREQNNVYCGEQRFWDTSANPAFAAAEAENLARTGQADMEDPFRDPWRWDGKRFRYQEVSFDNGAGDRLPGLLFRPCDGSCHDRPAGLGTYRPRYPGVVIVHGGAAQQEMYLWAAEGLAEAGYIVLTFQIPTADNTGGGTHYDNSKAALRLLPLHSRRAGDRRGCEPGLGRARPPARRPRRSLCRRRRRQPARPGGPARRVDRVMGPRPVESHARPTSCCARPRCSSSPTSIASSVPVCLPEPYTTPPDPLGPGNKDTDFQRLSAARIDTMKIALRAATHLDFTEFSPGVGSRYGAAVAFYYTLAWFDRYLKGQNRRIERESFSRLRPRLSTAPPTSTTSAAAGSTP